MSTRIQYLEGKGRRQKEEHSDLLNKFETTVKILSKNSKNDYEKEFQDRLEKVREDYNRKIMEKEETLHVQRREIDDKTLRVQTENKTLRDKLLIYEMRESGKRGKVEDLESKLHEQKGYYERIIG